MPFEPERLLPELLSWPRDGAWWVGFSGGADSMALLHALVTLRTRIPATIRALHVDHGLHPESAQWAEACAETCSRWSIPLRIDRVQVQRDSGYGLEAEARRERYAVAGSLLEAGDLFLTGHHADDQAETVLLNLMRGSGVDGLAGMPATRPLGRGMLVRPLLAFSGASLREHLSRHGLEWIEDSSNRDLAHDRNFVRHALLPLLERRWPGSSLNLNQSARHCREAGDFIAESCRGLLSGCLQNDRILDLSCLENRGTAMSGALPVKLLIRQWLRDQQAPGLPRDRMQELLRQLGSASAESHVTLRWEGWILQHYQSRLWLQREADIVSCPGLSWDPAQPLDLGPRLGTLSLRSPRARPGWRLRVEARRGGEKIACLPGGGHRSVKQILQESHVPPWLRTSVPILWLEDRVVAVGPLAMDNGFRSELEEQGFTLAWNPRDPLLKAVFTACRDDRG